MTRTSLLRLLPVLLFTLMLAVAVPTFAQETLPLPPAPPAAPEDNVTTDDIIVIIIPMAAQPLHPVNNGDVGFNQPFVWTSTDAAEYIIKITVKETGAKLTYKPPFSCSGGTCVAVSGDHTFALFDKLQDGQHISWQVISKFGDTKLKSAKASGTVNEVAQVTPSFPANGSTIALDSFKTLSWDGHHGANTSYQITIKDMNLNMVAYVRLLKNIPYGCNNPCSFEIYNVFDTFIKGHTYQWTVTAIGATGEKVKSTKATFTLN